MANDVRVEASPVGPVVVPPDQADLVILYLHDDLDDSAATLDRPGRLAALTGARVVCADYRATFPAALDDVHAGYDFCQQRGPVAVVGERVGAGLAASLMVRLRDTGAALPQCAVLVSALLDLTMETKSLQLNAGADPAFDVTEIRRRAAEYAGATTRTDALLSPVYANLHGFGPVQLLVAGTDPLLDDSLAFAARTARSHVTVDLRVWQDAATLHTEAIRAMAGFLAAWNPTARTASSRRISDDAVRG